MGNPNGDDDFDSDDNLTTEEQQKQQDLDEAMMKQGLDPNALENSDLPESAFIDKDSY